MNRTDALAYIEDNAATEVAPTLTAEEKQRCLDRARIVDSLGRLITDPLYEETIWPAKAVVNALDLKIAKAAGSPDFLADATTVYASQVTRALERLRSSWRARCVVSG